MFYRRLFKIFMLINKKNFFFDFILNKKNDEFKIKIKKKF